ncbi:MULTISPECIES: sigma-54-dependent transcriptional regulator [unclassified Variovorax]|uniref:sigma-54-dependent transcriptional regulator n=1 Tax=unclassified Variovorax TaxID=663243 RepID=UPI001318B20C|nr:MULTISPECIES: sigma-54 dependent transcriptional regulator [unclassified Variovorax]VTU13125.1 C4-dicarboxylate transport transcriptional regulatory protein DctD [Variovorax sp. SRS16]VTU17348.1 C4-dicarboxylate transport transcriptional regulatory protein DctD [Variovorax sp. PBL-E5]
MSEAISIRVLLIEDDDDVRQSTAQALTLAGFAVESFASVERARAQIVLGAPVVVVCDVRLPGSSGTDWLPEIRTIDAEIPVILITGHGHIAMAVHAMRDGAYDFIEKPFTSERMNAIVRHAVERRQLTLQVRALRDALENWSGIQGVLIGRSAQMQQVRATVMTLAGTSADVLIYGETGTGKELVARCLHDHGERRRQHFVPLNCGGLPESLAESELFGHEAGAFTSANRVRIGKFEYAHGGTLFLDEIESMPMAVQIKLLRALQERCIERIGSNKPIPFDCRVVAASKDDLKSLSDQQKFRADLYYRIGVAFIELPPLRERREDIPLLFEHFTLLAASRYERAAPMLTHAQLADLMAYAWPGNVRELRNVADRFVLGLLGERLTQARSMGQGPSALPHGLPQQVEHFERTVIVEELRRHRGDQPATAGALGIARQTLYDKLRKLGVSAEDFK